MAKLVTILQNIGLSFAVYFATLAGIFIAQFGPMLALGTPLSLKTYGALRLIISMLIAFYLVVGQEEGGDPVGKGKNLKRRIANALSHGVTYNALIGIAQQAAGAGGQ